ncbi:MAG: DMT family transporter [Burkholderiaceae bacterium]|jgi:drug/metabolite transporter (DMT)-like permease|nr:DMT family transporter [Burkholderiaceae bacterium]
MSTPLHSAHDPTPGLWWGVLGISCFALTLPAMRLATGTQSAPALSPWFVAWGGMALAGLSSAAFLLVTRSPWPLRAHLKPLTLAMLGHALGYPLLLGYAMRSVNASHTAVITALLPLATAALAAWVLRQSARLEFWLCAALGGALAVLFSLLRAYAQSGSFGFAWDDLLLAAAVLATAAGYVHGAQVAPMMGAAHVTCWVCVLALPFTLPGALLLWPAPAPGWGGFVFVHTGAASTWAGYFAWYRGLATGGALRVSQVQLLQPFIPIMASALMWDEAIAPLTLIFAAAIVITVVAQARKWPCQ